MSAAVPIAVVPSMNVTVPVGVAAPVETVATNVTPCPKTEGLGDEVTAVEVVCSETTCVTLEPLPAMTLASPP